MELIHNFNKRLACFGTAVTMFVTGYALSTPTNAYASTKDIKVKVETKVGEDGQETEDKYIVYTVQEGDTASKISSFLVSHFIKNHEVPEEDLEVFRANPDAACSFWPAVAYLNLNKSGKYRKHPDDQLILPGDYKSLKAINKEVKKTAWWRNTAKTAYPTQTTIYIDREEARRRIFEIYLYTNPDTIPCVDDDEVDRYLKSISTGKYKYKTKRGAKPTKEEDWYFYEDVQSPEEVTDVIEDLKIKSIKIQY